MAIPHEVIEDLWFPPVFAALLVAGLLFRNFPGLYLRLRKSGYSLHDIFVFWFSLTLLATGVFYAMMFIKYSNWLFAHEPEATFVGLIILPSLAGWIVAVYQAREAGKDEELFHELEGMSTVPARENPVSGLSKPFRFWALTNLLGITAYAIWIGTIIRKY